MWSSVGETLPGFPYVAALNAAFAVVESRRRCAADSRR